MSEVTDIVVPILQNLQADLGELKRKVDRLEAHGEKVESYITYSLGMITQHKIDIDRQGKSVLDLVRRVEALEDAT
jgi:hypothetical protein